jgi:hypothetical protein
VLPDENARRNHNVGGGNWEVEIKTERRRTGNSDDRNNSHSLDKS